jgi:TonB family protein
MKKIFTVLALMVMLLSSESLFAQRNNRRTKGEPAAVAGKVVNPTFNGGSIHDFALWVNSHVVMPRSFATSGISRVVLVEFVVTEDGSVVDIRSVFGSNSELNDAAVKAVSKSPKWTPAELNGEKVKVRMTVPVLFDGE